jgi:hypothetical protein
MQERKTTAQVLRHITTFSHIALLLALLHAVNATGQVCEKPLCPADETYAGRTGTRDGQTYGVCDSRPGIGGTLAHSLRFCEAGWTLDAASGVCRKGECCEKALCLPGETFTRSETDRGTRYGVCETKSGIDYISHIVRYCESGWELNLASGVCKKQGCGVAIRSAGPTAIVSTEVVRRPDLIIKDWWIDPDAMPGNKTHEVKFGQKYRVCFAVINIGLVRSDAFVIQGGGLGVSSSPSQRLAGLGPRESREGCLEYSTTPRPGTYRLTITADAEGAVTESNETNNSNTGTIVVVP